MFFLRGSSWNNFGFPVHPGLPADWNTKFAALWIVTGHKAIPSLEIVLVGHVSKIKCFGGCWWLVPDGSWWYLVSDCREKLQKDEAATSEQMKNIDRWNCDRWTGRRCALAKDEKMGNGFESGKEKCRRVTCGATCKRPPPPTSSRSSRLTKSVEEIPLVFYCRRIIFRQ